MWTLTHILSTALINKKGHGLNLILLSIEIGCVTGFELVIIAIIIHLLAPSHLIETIRTLIGGWQTLQLWSTFFTHRTSDNGVPTFEIDVPDRIDGEIRRLVDQGDFLTKEQAFEELIERGLATYGAEPNDSGTVAEDMLSEVVEEQQDPAARDE